MMLDNYLTLKKDMKLFTCFFDHFLKDMLIYLTFHFIKRFEFFKNPSFHIINVI